MIHIVLADDHEIIRCSLRRLLEDEADIKIVGEASNGVEAIELVEQLKPDILILDMVMPGMNGIEVTTRLTKNCPGTKIIILSMHNNEGYIRKMLHSGAMAYILKDNTAEELIPVILKIGAGIFRDNPVGAQ